MSIVQQATGTFNGTSIVPTLPGASSASNGIVVCIGGNTTVTTPASWTLRTSQVNQMGHYWYDRLGVSLTSVTITASAGQGTWWIAEIAGPTYDTSTSANSTSGASNYNTPNLTPATGTKDVLASIAGLGASARTVSGWTNSYVEQADVSWTANDFPMQGVALLAGFVGNSATTTATTATYSNTSTGRSAIIASYTSSAGSPAVSPEIVMSQRAWNY